MAYRHDLGQIAELRAHGCAQGWPISHIVEAIVGRFDVSPLKAQRLARGWTRRQAVKQILATYHADGLRPPALGVQRLCTWEHKPRVRPNEDYLDRLCRVYQTRPDQLCYGRDYTQATTPTTGDATPAAYPRTSSAGEEADTDRGEFFQAMGATGLAALLDRASGASLRLARALGASNLGPATVEQLELRVAGFVQRYNHTPLDRLFAEVLAQQQEVAALLDGPQPLRQRRELHRIGGQLALLLGLLSFDLGDSPAAGVHALTAGQLAYEVGDRTLTGWARWLQSVVTLWAGDARAALDYARDGQRYASGDLHARLAGYEARACARMSDRGGAADALRRTEQAMPSQLASSGSSDGLFVFTQGNLQLKTASSLLWLGDATQAEPHARQAIAWYQAAPPALQDPSSQAEARIMLAICLVRQDQPDDGIRLAADALRVDRVHVEPNLAQADEFIAALTPAHRDLAAARDLTEQLQAIRAGRG
ncbi:MAG: hypothetical protein ACRD0K_20295 [Egibacteraceae bacterium]